MPFTVKAVELLYKDDNSPSVYSIISFDRQDAEFTAAADGDYTGSYTIQSNIFGTTLPDNQILRAYDSVPRKALAQEVTGSRLLFGNYVEGHDLLDSNGDRVQLDMDVFVKPYIKSSTSIFNESVKSGRTYQLGVVYRDDMGRESTVLTSKNCVINVPYEYADTSNRLGVKIKSNAPYWATSYKVFIKDVLRGSESLKIMYANLGDDSRWYFGFSSDQKWKVEEGSRLKLKVPHSQANAGTPDYPTSYTHEVVVEEVFNSPPDAIGDNPGSSDGLFFYKG